MLSKRSSLLVRMSQPPPPPTRQFLASIGKDKDGITEKPADDETLTIGQSSTRLATGLILAIIVPVILWISGSALETFLEPDQTCVTGITTPIKTLMCDSTSNTFDDTTITEWKATTPPGYIGRVMGLVREHTIPKVVTLASICLALVLITTGLLYWIIGFAGCAQFLNETWSDDHQITAVILFIFLSGLIVGVLTLETYLRFIWHCITLIKNKDLKPPDKNSMYFLGFIFSLFLWFSVMAATQSLGGYQVLILIILAIACVAGTKMAVSGVLEGRLRKQKREDASSL